MINYLHIRYLQPWVLPPHQKEAIQGNTEILININIISNIQGNTEVLIFDIQFSIFSVLNIQGNTEILIFNIQFSKFNTQYSYSR